MIERVESGALYFAGFLSCVENIGPVKVDQKASALAQVGWRVTLTLTLARLRGTWKIVEVGNVYPG